jgi:protein-S-isoprenylcysteine O-methyltransferase Ste14
LSPRWELAFLRAIDTFERIFVFLLFVRFVLAISHGIALRPYNILLLISEGLIALFILIRRPAVNITTRPLDWLIAMGGTCLPLFVLPGAQPLLPTFFGTALMFAGLLLSIWAKLSLRRSFGLAAANRGAVICGPYRFVRHPMYAGYIIIYVGFLLNNPLMRNLYIYTAALALQVLRVLAEESILKTDPIYDAYVRRVRFRLIPAVF